ncbi:MAG: hypothetical protein H0U76_09710 [Ktedonobacteraceae bacterium]|nr:hypothetical protein [Ktedonobacteraceae bacterium]
MNKKVELIHAEKPLLLVVDPSPVFLGIIKAALRRAGCEVKSVSFQQTEKATFWLSGAMDREKAEKYPYPTSWDHYPALSNPVLAIINLGFPLDDRERVMDWLYVHHHTTKIITTSTKEELLALGDDRDELYWRLVVSHLSQPITGEAVLEQVVPVLCS